MKSEFQATWLGLGAATVCAGALLFIGAAAAQAPADDWQFRATIYGYFPDIGASAAFPAGPSTTIDVNANKLISHLKLAFMGSIEAQKGRWGAFTDVMYFSVGGSRSGVRDLAISGMQLPTGITADASLDIDAWVWTLAGSYRAVSDPVMSVDVFAGARLLNVDSRLGWEFSTDFGPFVGPGRQGSADAKLNNWDGVVGVKGRLNFGANREWFVPYYVDVGTDDSDLTWQGIARIGYAFKWGEVIAAWRCLKYDFKSDQKLENLTFNGPAIGVAFRW